MLEMLLELHRNLKPDDYELQYLIQISLVEIEDQIRMNYAAIFTPN